MTVKNFQACTFENTIGIFGFWYQVKVLHMPSKGQMKYLTSAWGFSIIGCCCWMTLLCIISSRFGGGGTGGAGGRETMLCSLSSSTANICCCWRTFCIFSSSIRFWSSCLFWMTCCCCWKILCFSLSIISSCTSNCSGDMGGGEGISMWRSGGGPDIPWSACRICHEQNESKLGLLYIQPPVKY